MDGTRDGYMFMLSMPGSLFNQIEDVRTGLRLFMDDTGFI